MFAETPNHTASALMGLKFETPLEDLLIGIVAGVVVIFGDWLIRWVNNRRWYSKLNGDYVGEWYDGTSSTAEVFTIKHRGGRVLAIHAKQGGQTTWEATITMSGDVADYGSGVFQYASEKKWGLLNIKMNHDGSLIQVHGVDKHCASNNEGRDYSFSYLMKRKPV